MNTKLVCPLFNFEVSEVLIGKFGEDAFEYLKSLRDKFDQGFEFLGNAKLRRIKKEDLDKIQEFNNIHPFVEPLSRINAKTFVLEFSANETKNQDWELFINKVLLSMRLHKEGDVFCKVVWPVSKTSHTLVSLDPPMPEEHLAKPYVLKIEEIEEIRKIFDRIDKADFEKRNSLRIACERFSRSYEKYAMDEKIVDFMIAFEALFLKGEKALSSIGQMIGLACSMLLGKNDSERNVIYMFLLKAYRVRNKIVHGSESFTYEEEEDGNLVSQLKDYLRESIKRLI